MEEHYKRLSLDQAARLNPCAFCGGAARGLRGGGAERGGRAPASASGTL